MKVALLQIRLDARSPASNLQCVLRAIDRAAGATPAPDLLILPGACDTGGPAAALPIAVLESFKEALGYKAREWGLFIAAGLCVWDDDGAPTPASVMFDPDGDVVASSVASGWEIELWPSTVGVLGVFEPTASRPTDGVLSVPVGNAFVAMPLGRGGSAKQKRNVQAMADALGRDASARAGLCWGVVSPAEPDGARATASTFVLGEDGAPLAQVDTTEETILHVEVPLAPATAEDFKTLLGEKDDAD